MITDVVDLTDSSLTLFHPVIQEWFRGKFAHPTDPQEAGWPEIDAGRHTLIAAPTGSGKTLTAFLAIINRLLLQRIPELEGGRLPKSKRHRSQGIQVVYVSPLRALSNDMQRNLHGPLEEIHQTAQRMGLDIPQLKVGLRTGDTPSHQRQKLVKHPPDILVTTPESLYLMLTAEKSREVLRHVDTVIIDEIHALVRDKRGSHLALTLERLEALIGGTSEEPSYQRIGLSATQRPIERMAEFLVGGRKKKSQQLDLFQQNGKSAGLNCSIIDVGHKRDLDLAIETPPSDLSAVCSMEQWDEVNQRLVELINQHRSTLVFVNTRRLAERVTFQLTQLLGEEQVGAHHGSLSKEIRLDTEQKLKHGQLKAVVATASLELGIDVGYIDLVVQLGSPRAIAAFLQRIGRSGHALGLVPKGRLFALTRDELMECQGLIRAVEYGRLDIIPIPEAPLDILTQQIVAELACEEWDADELYHCLKQAWAYRNLPREKFEQSLKILSEGLTPTAGRTRALIYHDKINGRLRGRPAARMAAIMNGGAIPELDNVRVMLEDENVVVGSVDEEFAVESSAGDIFLLGNSSWRIRGLRGNDLMVSDAHGAPPTIPFWRGEAPGRTLELSEEVSLLREEIEKRLIELERSSENGEWDISPIVHWLKEESHSSEHAAQQIVEYVAAQRAGVGFVPTQKRILFERFFDESGGMQLVVHAPFGGRINRAWGLAFRKRFCRSFDFELQATADDDGFILSLGPQHSFPIESLFSFMRPDNARALLEQAMLVSPMFHMRWRWNVTRALFLARMQNGKKVPPALQRFRSEDLLTAVFPKLTGCQEEHMGDHEIPDHPLMKQTVEDVLFEALDIEGLVDILGKVQAGEISYVGRDTREPSPFAYELLNANPYAFLDGGEVQERRARAVATPRTINIDSMRDLGKLDETAIVEVVAEAQPRIRSADELHDILLSRVFVPIIDKKLENNAAASLLAWPEADNQDFLAELTADGRVVKVVSHERSGYLATERFSVFEAIDPELTILDDATIPDSVREEWDSVEAMSTLMRGWLETCGPVTADEIAELLGQRTSRVFATLEALEGEGAVLRGRFRSQSWCDDAVEGNAKADAEELPPIEWCHRRLLARIHRRTIVGLRKEIEAVSPDVYLEFLAQHQGALLGHRKQGVDGVHEVISQLQGMDFAAAAWEESILPLRVDNYQPQWIDELCMSGDVGWARLEPTPARKGTSMSSITRVVPVSLFLRDDLDWLISRREQKVEHTLSSNGEDVLQMLTDQGALFANDILKQSDMLPTQLNDVLGELVSYGLVTADGFSGLRRLTRTDQPETTTQPRSRKTRVRRPVNGVGRWNLWEPAESEVSHEEVLEEWAWQLIRRWGVVFRELVLLEKLAPKWWELQRVFRRLEARGELRGGRFIKSVGGEQFATSDAVRELREIRKRERSEREHLLVVSGVDPLNLTGIIGSGSRIPGIATNRVAYLAGKVVGWKKGDETWIAPSLAEEHSDALAIQFGLKRRASNRSTDQPPKKRKRRRPQRGGVPKPFPF